MALESLFRKKRDLGMSETDQSEMLDSDGEELGTPPPLENDSLIQNIVRLAMDGVGLDVTLTVNGLLVCGRVVSGKQYFERTTALFESAEGSHEAKKVIRTLLESYLTVYDKNDPEYGKHIGFIHLKDVTFHSPSGGAGIPNGKKERPMWRGKISHVSGVNFGRLGALA